MARMFTGCCLATADSPCSTILAFSHYATICISLKPEYIVIVFYVPCWLLRTDVKILNWEVNLPTFNSWTLVSLFSQSHLTVSVVLYLSLMQGLARSMLYHKEADSATSRHSLQTRDILEETNHLYCIWYHINGFCTQKIPNVFSGSTWQCDYIKRKQTNCSIFSISYTLPKMSFVAALFIIQYKVFKGSCEHNDNLRVP
jgi:hypothetical protein